MQQSQAGGKPAINKDYYGGALMVLIGVSAIYAASGYHIGSLSRMGPGFFPAAIGTLLACVGVLIAASARRKPETDKSEGGAAQHGHPTSLPDPRAAACIVLGILAFLLLGEYGGLLPATFGITFISALGDRTNTWRQALILALAMCAVAVVVFWWALQLQLPLFQWGR